MKNKSVSSSGKGFASWIEDFIIGLSAKEASTEQPQSEVQEDEKEEVLAEINVNDLDKVVWKDETFSVHFDPKGASLINEFGNVVRTLQDAATIEDVDKQLNGSEIVTSSIEEEPAEDDLEEELNKLATSLEDSTEEPIETEEVTASEDEDEDLNNEVVAAIASGFEEMEANINKIYERLALVEQQYARNPQIQDLSDNSQEEEVKHFTETADESAKEVAHEHEVDITSPAGRVELSQQPQASEVEEIITQDTTPDAPIADPNGEQMNTETPAEEAPKATETPVEETKEPEAEEKEEDESEKPATEEKKEEKVAEVIDEDIDDEEDPAVQKVAEMVEEDIDDEEPAVEKLAGAAEKIFQKGICPETGEELIKSKTVGNYLGVYSSAGTEYAVDLDNGSIYKYLK